jgi:hypothetical protein
MAKQFTGIDGALYADGNKVAKITDWAFSGSVDTLECTTLGDYARKYIYGVQSFNGNCTLLYYEEDSRAISGSALITDVVRTTQTPTEPTHRLELRYMNGAKTHSVSFDCLLPNVSIAAQVGEIVTASVSFTVNGPLTTATLD